MDWKVCIITYNVNMQRCIEEAVHRMLTPTLDEAPSLLVVGMQEVAHAETVGGAVLTWHRVMVEWMSTHTDLVMLTKTYQATNQISIFIKRKLIGLVGKVDFRYGRNTMGGLTGHKGSIGVRISLRNKTHIVFVTSHFIHDVVALHRRLEQYQSNRICSFPDDRDVKCVFWFGDLNFRVEMEPEDALRSLRSGNKQDLFDTEQLKRCQQRKEIFIGYHESDIEFNPTYRMLVGSDEYDLKRTPSWCDRILYKGDSITPVSYSSNDKVLVSDHIPVQGVYHYKSLVPATPEWDVHFEHLPQWYSTIPVICRFQYKNDYWSSRGSYKDWVGLFPATIDDCTNSIKWVWLATCFGQSVAGEYYTVCEFAPMPEGIYRLGYFSSSANCLVGLSKKFEVKDPPA